MSPATAQVIEITKRCPKCGITKSLVSGYYVRRASANGRACYCKECELQARKSGYEKTKVKEQRKSSQYKSRYGLTLAEAREMLRQQFGLCANRGCGKPLSFDVAKKGDPEYANSAVVDHCHRTGKVRGILCHRCNMLAGIVENHRSGLLNILEYLAREN